MAREYGGGGTEVERGELAGAVGGEGERDAVKVKLSG
jgi:hypothetical protein